MKNYHINLKPARVRSALVRWDLMHIFCCPISCSQVQKKPDMMNEELLSDGTHEDDSGFWTSLTRYTNPPALFSSTSALIYNICQLNGSFFLSFRGFTGASKPEEPKQEKDDVINIFSVASGHLYERFLR